MADEFESEFDKGGHEVDRITNGKLDDHDADLARDTAPATAHRRRISGKRSPDSGDVQTAEKKVKRPG